MSRDCDSNISEGSSGRRVCLVALPKPFIGEAADLQETALKSWQEIDGLDILLVGNESDLATIPEGYDVKTRFISPVEDHRRDSVLPYFSQVLDTVPAESDYDTIVYLNADIVLPRDFVDRLQLSEVHRECGRGFLITGRRIEMQEGVSFARGSDFYPFLSENMNSWNVGRFDHMDYFVFKRGIFSELPPLIVGRGAYDNALVAYCLRGRVPVIDASEGLPVIHPFHGHGHQKGGKKEVYDGNDAMLNRKRHDIIHSPPTLFEAGLILGEKGLRRNRWRGGILRRWEAALRYVYKLKLLSYALRVPARLLDLEMSAEEKEQRRITGKYYEMLQRISAG